jgi:hypothetical protein
MCRPAAIRQMPCYEARQQRRGTRNSSRDDACPTLTSTGIIPCQFFLRHVSATNRAANPMGKGASSYYPDICLKGRWKPTKNLSEDS